VKKRKVLRVIPNLRNYLGGKKMREMYGDKEQEIVEDDERMDIIGQNGNDGLHYDEEPNEPLEENDPGRPPLRGGVKIL